MLPNEVNYCPFEHIARAVLLDRWRGSWWFAVATPNALTAYFDDSRTDLTHDYSVVGGFISTMDLWEMFNAKWRIALETANLSDGLHMKTFYPQRGQLQWTDEQRTKKEGDLKLFATISTTHALYAVRAVVDNRIYRQLFEVFKSGKQKEEFAPFSSPYALAAWACCEAIDDQAIRIAPLREPMQVIFDAGNPSHHHFLAGYKRYRSQKVETCLPKYPIPGDDKIIFPLQAADQYAWEMSRFYCTNGAEHDTRPTLQMLLRCELLEIKLNPPWIQARLKEILNV